MLAWAYFVALWRGDWIRAPQILITLQQFLQAHLDVFGQGLSAQTRALFANMQATGMYDELARAALQRALFYGNVFTADQLRSMPLGCVDEAHCPTNAGASAAASWAAVSFIPLKTMDDPIWAAWNIANSVAAQDAAPHLQSWAQNFVDGVDTTSAHQAVATPEQQIATEAPAVPSAPADAFFIPGQNVQSATNALWPWAIGTVAVVTLGVGLLFFPWHKVKRSRRRTA